MKRIFSSRAFLLALALTTVMTSAFAAGLFRRAPKPEPAPAPTPAPVAAPAAPAAAAKAPAAGGKAAAAAIANIPLRSPKVQEGDWVLYRNDEGLRLETAEKIEPQPGGDLMIFYTMRDVLPNGKVEEGNEVVRMASQEKVDLTALAGTLQNPKVERRQANIDGRKANVFVIADVRDGFSMEYWYTDEFTIDGQVLSQVIIAGVEDQPAQTEKLFEAVAFGNVKQPFNPRNVKKYVK